MWFPLGVMLIPVRGIFPALLFMAACAVFISFLDNFIRPLLLKDRIKIHPLLIFFSILGGVKFFGLNGIILGPMTVILFFTIVDMVTADSPGKRSVRRMQNRPPLADEPDAGTAGEPEAENAGDEDDGCRET